MPKTEKALYTTGLKAIRGGFGRVYFGAEFCQWRMPGARTVVSAYSRAAGLGMGFTLMTPWLTDAGLGRLAKSLDALTDAAKGAPSQPEVVVNDYGALALVNENYPHLTPVLGRLLVRQKRCPRIPGLMGSLPDAGKDLYLGAGVEDPLTARLLRGWGVRRVELDAPLQGIAVDLGAARLKGSLYTPYAYVTVTRHCPASFDGRSWQAFTGCRVKGCLKDVIEMRSPAHEAPLVMRGNAQFVHNPAVPGGLAAMGIDRLVVMEDVP